ncbi:MAG: DUF2225 domain-containing protein [Spirochaetaceae bacterium]|jgi:uncharacterized protein (DUF2225 family)|nr:DUF2225 domain-containing protein [Spirochaetaceae bacterium]
MMDVNRFEDREIKISFLSKDEIRCPLCDALLQREELLSGGGRLIAGALTDELHRLYEPSVKFGTVYPLNYPVTVCPECWFAAWDKDFQSLPENRWDKAMQDREARVEEVQKVFPPVDFSGPRGLVEGAVSHYLALKSYDYFPKEFSPTIKQAISALRGGWLLDELHGQHPDQNFDWLSRLFKKKAQFLYSEAVLREQSGKEPLSGIKNFGPDTDKNYGYEGVLYLAGLLQYKYGIRDTERRADLLGEAKRTIAKIFGLGKSTKSKPGPLLEHARQLYDNINIELNETDE